MESTKLGHQSQSLWLLLTWIGLVMEMMLECFAGQFERNWEVVFSMMQTVMHFVLGIPHEAMMPLLSYFFHAIPSLICMVEVGSRCELLRGEKEGWSRKDCTYKWSVVDKIDCGVAGRRIVCRANERNLFQMCNAAQDWLYRNKWIFSPKLNWNKMQ